MRTSLMICYYMYVMFVLFLFFFNFFLSFTIFFYTPDSSSSVYTYTEGNECIVVGLSVFTGLYTVIPGLLLVHPDFRRSRAKERDVRFLPSVKGTKNATCDLIPVWYQVRTHTRRPLSRYVCVYIHINTVVCTSWYILYVQSYNC